MKVFLWSSQDLMAFSPFSDHQIRGSASGKNLISISFSVRILGRLGSHVFSNIWMYLSSSKGFTCILILLHSLAFLLEWWSPSSSSGNLKSFLVIACFRRDNVLDIHQVHAVDHVARETPHTS